MMERENNSTKYTEKNLCSLDELNNEIIPISEKMVSTYAIYSYDLYCTGILNRLINLNRGFITLIRDNNFIAASSLVRLNLDSLLRLHAPKMVDYSIDDFANKVMYGESIRNLKDRDGKKLFDKNIVDSLKEYEGFEWVGELYSICNNYIHYSERHIWSSTKISDKGKGNIQSRIYKGDPFMTDGEKAGAVKWMIKVTEGILFFVNEWIARKVTYLDRV